MSLVFNPFTSNFDEVSDLTVLVGSSPNANASTIVQSGTSIALTLQPANTSFPGVLLAADWNTFNNKQPAGNYITDLTGDVTASGPGSAVATLATVNANVGSFSPAAVTVNAKGLVTAASNVATSDLTDVGTDGIVITGGTGAVLGSGTSIAQQVSDTTHNGYLSSTDWNTFNNKQPAGSYITALTGDGTASGPGSAAFTLATVNTNVGSFSPAAITVNGKGLITAASNVTTGDLTDAGTDGITVTGGTGAVLGSGTSLSQHVADATHNGYLSSTDWSTFNGKQAAGNYITALTGDVTASGPGSAAATLATVNTNVGSFTNANITVNAKGLITAAANGSSSGTTAPNIQTFSATGTTTGYVFVVSSANATVGATYTNNGHTYTVQGTISASTLLFTSGASAPTASGTLTKSGGTGDATITFSSNAPTATYTTPTGPSPLYLRIRAVGGGGGGAGSGTGSGGGTGGTGTPTYFGANTIICNGGNGGTGGTGGSVVAGGTATINSPAQGVAISGQGGGAGGESTAAASYSVSGYGGSSPFGPGGVGTTNANPGPAAGGNGAGGAGGGYQDGATAGNCGGGAGAGGYVDAIISSPAASYPYLIGLNGTHGGAGTGGNIGGDGTVGFMIIEAFFQ